MTALRAPEVKAAFSSEVQAALKAEPGRVAVIAGRMLEQHFPESLHQDILDAVGLSVESGTLLRKRDPSFRQRVLKAYVYRCAVCGFDVRLGSISIALDAAHIRWRQSGGPDEESNGLALCVLHHKTFDLGAFTVSGGVVLVSDGAHGTNGFDQTLMAYHARRFARLSDPTGGRSRTTWNGTDMRCSRASRGIASDGWGVSRSSLKPPHVLRPLTRASLRCNPWISARYPDRLSAFKEFQSLFAVSVASLRPR